MRGDMPNRDEGFRRGAAHHAESAQPPGEARPDLVTPPAGRDVALMFWESIGMKPGDDWTTRARPLPDGEQGG